MAGRAPTGGRRRGGKPPSPRVSLRRPEAMPYIERPRFAESAACMRASSCLRSTFILYLLLFALAWADSAPARPLIAPDAPLNEEVLAVPVSTAPLVRLVVTIYMPSGAGPFPLAVINHGSYFDPPRA